YLALNSTDQGSHPASGIYFYYDGTLKGGITWGGFDNLISIGNMNVNLSNYRVGVGAIIPQNLLDVMGAGTAWGGVNGYTEVVGHFTTTGSGHTAISVDAVTDQDAILYLAENGKAYWDLRNDSDNGKQFELRYHGLGAKNVTHVAVDTLGNVGIGTTNTSGYKLYVAGTAYSTGGWSSSDARLKDKIAPIEAALSKALALRGVSFEWRRAEFPDKGLPEGRHYGLIAQEVEKVLPEVVKEGPNGDKAVAYSEIIPVLVESIKELKAENESLRQRIEALEQAHGRE
ncbi:MAG TPA: tail fiber domain-containing protein, partial [bacterium]|nr:tail fiber domain-containing protein [bacterium]